MTDLRIEEGEGGGPGPAPAHGSTIDFHRIDSAAEVGAFGALAGVLVLLGAGLLWLPWRERNV